MPRIADNVSIRSIHERYQFKKKLGKGGFCDVFHAVEKASGRQVAIKMMQKTDENENDESRRTARFKREMLLYSELDHPNIVSVLESGQTENVLYIVFEYIDGETLGSFLKKQGALTVKTAMSIAGQVLDGLVVAHDRGIIHRDLKPDNIMVVQTEHQEKATIVDFGISTFMPDKWKDFSRLTVTREFLGTPAYASPEQLRGEPVTVKTDLYSFGLILHECLTGKSPFAGDSTAGVVYQQLSFAAPLQIPLPLMDHPLGALLSWLTEKNVDRRAGNSRHVLERLKCISVDSIPQKNGFLSHGDFLPRQEGPETPHAYESPAALHERRQVTVLCFTINIEVLSDEASIDIVDEIYYDLLQHCAEKVKELGGYVVGDASNPMVACFGYPQASDTDARRATLAALKLLTDLARKDAFFTNKYGLTLTCHFGLHTGMITRRSAAPDKEKLSGITLNLATKLCAAAPANTIIMSEECCQLLKGAIEYEPIGADTIAKGIPFKNVYRVIGERSIEGLAGLARTSRSPMIGRVFEQAMIVRTWDEIQREKKGKVICLRGEAGIGKSRLAAECAITIQRDKQGAWMGCRCTPENINSSFSPFIDFIKTQLGLSDTANWNKNTHQVLVEKIRELGMSIEDTLPLLCPWLCISSEQYPLPPYSPQKIKELFLKMAVSLISRIARSANAVIMIEDLHWIDGASLELLQLLIEQVRKDGLLMLLTARPEFVPGWVAQDVEIVNLTPLDGKEMETLITDILKGRAIPEGVLREIVLRSDYIPLFGEQLAFMYLEKTKETATRQSCEKGFASGEIPNSLRDLLAGRLDRLGPAKETAQLAAALGRTFHFNVLSKISWRDEASLLADLDQLVSAGLLHLRLRVGDPEYQFQHALFRDAAYNSLAPRTRTEIHQRIVQSLEREFADIVKLQPETLARHCVGAGEFEKASVYGTRAAGTALSRGLNEEAIAHSQSVLEWIQKLPPDRRSACELTINGILTQAMMFRFGWAHPEVKSLAERSRFLLKEIGNNEHTFSTLWALATYHHVASNRKEVRELTDEMAAFAARANDPGLVVAADTFLGLRKQTDGDFAGAAKHLESAVAGYDPRLYADHGERFGMDTGTWAAATLRLVYSLLGYDGKAFEMGEKAAAWANQSNHKPSMAICTMYTALAFQAMQDKKNVSRIAGELAAMSEQWGLPAYHAYGMILLCWATGDIAQADAITGALLNMGCRLCVPLYKSLAADNEAEKGDFAAAVRRLDECIQLCAEIDEKFYEPVLYFQKGLFLSIMNPSDKETALKSLAAAERLARGSGMLRIELYALGAMQKLADSPDRGKRLMEIGKERPELMTGSGQK